MSFVVFGIYLLCMRTYFMYFMYINNKAARCEYATIGNASCASMQALATTLRMAEKVCRAAIRINVHVNSTCIHRYSLFIFGSAKSQRNIRINSTSNGSPSIELFILFFFLLSTGEVSKTFYYNQFVWGWLVLYSSHNILVVHRICSVECLTGTLTNVY